MNKEARREYRRKYRAEGKDRWLNEKRWRKPDGKKTGFALHNEKRRKEIAQMGVAARRQKMKMNLAYTVFYDKSMMADFVNWFEEEE